MMRDFLRALGESGLSLFVIIAVCVAVYGFAKALLP